MITGDPTILQPQRTHPRAHPLHVRRHRISCLPPLPPRSPTHPTHPPASAPADLRLRLHSQREFTWVMLQFLERRGPFTQGSFQCRPLNCLVEVLRTYLAAYHAVMDLYGPESRYEMQYIYSPTDALRAFDRALEMGGWVEEPVHPPIIILAGPREELIGGPEVPFIGFGAGVSAREPSTSSSIVEHPAGTSNASPSKKRRRDDDEEEDQGNTKYAETNTGHDGEAKEGSVQVSKTKKSRRGKEQGQLTKEKWALKRL